MISRTWELAGFALITIALGILLGTPAALLTAGAFCILIALGTSDETDERAVLKVRDAIQAVRDAYHRQMARERGEAPRTRESVPQLIACSCSGDPECPVCGGDGIIPNPAWRENETNIQPSMDHLFARLEEEQKRRRSISNGVR